jgi:corrinoid protein of di/trimethylamine methyltransferase
MLLPWSAQSAKPAAKLDNQQAKERDINMEILNQISESLQKGKAKDVKLLVNSALEQGLSAQQVLNEGLLAGMNVIGVKFKNNEVYVPDVLVAARAMKAGTEILKPLLAADGVKASGKVVLGTVKGDLHDIGKNLVGMMMEGKGLEVIDVGTDVPAEKFIEAAIEHKAQIIACTALLTTTMGEFTPIIEAAKAAGIRDNVVIMVGGAPVTDAFAKSVGADIYTPDAASAAEEAVKALLK